MCVTTYVDKVKLKTQNKYYVTNPISNGEEAHSRAIPQGSFDHESIYVNNCKWQTPETLHASSNN